VSLDVITSAARKHALAVLGGLHPGPGDGAPPGCGTLVLLGPDEPDFWNVFAVSPEYRDGAPDPLDRWSRRVIGALAESVGAAAVFPFGGPPYAPFVAWAQRSGRAWPSPVGLLVHDVAGLFVSYRGALALPDRLPLPGPGRRPCDSCDAPCLTACPAGALNGSGYAVADCRAFLDTAAGADCMGRGCAVRRACPVGRGRRLAAQSAFHMADFGGRQGACGD
jgi:epoxyqueuosine reductase